MSTLKSKTEYLHSVLLHLRSVLPQVQGALLADPNGAAIVSVFETGRGDLQRLAALASTGIAVGQRLSEIVETQPLSEMSVSSTQGQVFIYRAGQKGALIVLVPSDMNLGLLHLEARKATVVAAHIL